VKSKLGVDPKIPHKSWNPELRNEVKNLYSRKVLSIDIGTANIKIVVGKQINKAISVEKKYMIPTPPNSYDDGQLLMPEKLYQEIHRLLTSEKIRVKKAICTVESSSIITREIIIPYAKVKDLKNLVKFEIQQYLPIVIEEYLVEHKVIEEIIEEDTKKLKLQVAVLPKKIALAYLKLLQSLKLKPLALDIQNNGISKLFEYSVDINNENSSFEKTVAVIDMGHSQINLSIIDKGIQRFSRIIPGGGKNMDINIANSFNLSIKAAEEKKIEYGSLENLKDELSSHDMVNELIHSTLVVWLEDIQRIFKYYTSRNTGNRIDEIYIYGGSSKIKGLDQFMSTFLDIPTFKIETMSNIKYVKELDMKDLEYYLNAVASIIRR
jgi:type IV pilus assembly protein PilM